MCVCVCEYVRPRYLSLSLALAGWRPRTGEKIINWVLCRSGHGTLLKPLDARNVMHERLAHHGTGPRIFVQQQLYIWSEWDECMFVDENRLGIVYRVRSGNVILARRLTFSFARYLKALWRWKNAVKMFWDIYRIRINEFKKKKKKWFGKKKFICEFYQRYKIKNFFFIFNNNYSKYSATKEIKFLYNLSSYIKCYFNNIKK